jgi:hypothetical protein
MCDDKMLSAPLEAGVQRCWWKTSACVRSYFSTAQMDPSLSGLFIFYHFSGCMVPRTEVCQASWHRECEEQLAACSQCCWRSDCDLYVSRAKESWYSHDVLSKRFMTKSSVMAGVMDALLVKDSLKAM